MNNTSRIIISSVLVVCVLLSTSAFAAIYHTSAASAESKSIYVAGNPNLYPVEYYDEESGCYMGIMPVILEEISKEIGYDFTYIESGKEDKRFQLTRNHQVELVSGCLTTEDYSGLIEFSDVVLEYPVDGEEKPIAFGFTKVADESFVTAFTSALSNISDKRMVGLALTTAEKAGTNQIPINIIVITSGIILVFILLSVYVVFKFRKQKLKKKQHMYIDSLTGLGNEEYFNNWLTKNITDLMRPVSYSVYIGFDANWILSSFGNEEYRDLVRYVTDILISSVGDLGTVAKISDGGFIILQIAMSKDEIKMWATVLLDKLNKYDRLIPAQLRPIFRCGIYPLRQDDSDCKKAVFNALRGYRRASDTKKLIVFVDPEVLLLDMNNEKYRKQIADGLKNGEFRPYLQFIVDARTEEIKCAELLSRWEHPEKGMLRISEYLDLVIQIGLIEEYDQYIFRRTCDLLEEIHRSGNDEFRVSCNITQMTLSDEKFIEKIEAILKEYSFRRSNLVVEVTEDSLVEKQTVAVKNIERCKEIGLGIAIDDMGTGYASFELLSILPVDAIKIAREIVVSAKTDKGNKLLSGIIALASSMELRTVCEGVEDELTAEIVRQAGCDYIQGFYYANVLPISEAKRILKIGEGTL